MSKTKLMLAIALFVPIATVGSASALENLDPLCASCHTQPETEYFDRSLTLPSDLASAHTPEEVRCIDCHSGAGLAGRAGSLRQGASDLIAFASDDYTAPAVTTNPVGDGACIKCHGQPSAIEDLSAPVEDISSSHYHFMEYTAEWNGREPDPRGTCVICHAAHSLEGLEGQAFTSNAAVQPACEACHEALSGWLP
jgi:hypothetical protein